MNRILIFLFILCTVRADAQQAKKITDDYTGEVRYQSEWAKLNEAIWSFKGLLSYVRFNYIDSIYVMEFKVSTDGNYLSAKQGADFHIKFEDGSVLHLKNQEYSLAGKGEAAIGYYASEAVGLYLFFTLDRASIEKLGTHRIEKCRIMTTEGPLEVEASKKKYQEDVMLKAKHLLLVVDHDLK